MKNLSVLNNKTMSSLEIAELTGKDHSKVIRDIRVVLEQAEIDESKFGSTYLDNANRKSLYFNLPKRECDLVISGYSVKYRLLIIDRWHELELLEPPEPIVPVNYIEALKALIISEEQKQLAIETKAEIGHRREATAMNTASQAIKKVTKLEVELDKSKEYCSVKRMQMINHGQKFNWRILKSAGVEMNVLPIDIFDANYGTVKAYHKSVWKEAYSLDIV